MYELLSDVLPELVQRCSLDQIITCIYERRINTYYLFCNRGRENESWRTSDANDIKIFKNQISLSKYFEFIIGGEKYNFNIKNLNELIIKKYINSIKKISENNDEAILEIISNIISHAPYYYIYCDCDSGGDGLCAHIPICTRYIPDKYLGNDVKSLLLSWK